MESPQSALSKARGLIARMVQTQALIGSKGTARLLYKYGLPCIEAIDEATFDSKPSLPLPNAAYNELSRWVQELQVEMYGASEAEQQIYKRLIRKMERRMAQVNKPQ